MSKLTLESKITELGLSSKVLKKLVLPKEVSQIGSLIGIPTSLISKQISSSTFEELVSTIHSHGFVFNGEPSYTDIINKHICKKLGITNISSLEKTNEIKRKMLDLAVWELIPLVKERYHTIMEVYPYPEIRLRDILLTHINSESKTDMQSIKNKNAYRYIYYLGETKKPEEITKKSRKYELWIEAIHELGFYFSDENNYLKDMQELLNNRDLKKERLYIEAKKILSLNKSLPINKQTELIEALANYPDLVKVLSFKYSNNPIIIESNKIINKNSELKLIKEKKPFKK